MNIQIFYCNKKSSSYLLRKAAVFQASIRWISCIKLRLDGSLVNTNPQNRVVSRHNTLYTILKCQKTTPKGCL